MLRLTSGTHGTPGTSASVGGGTAYIARAAVRGLYQEVALEPKPGLVSLRDNGSHSDMTAATFMRSLFALRHYFAAIAEAGQRAAPLAVLQGLGSAAEARMLQATGGVNTHRGAVFSMGLLCAAAGALTAAGQPLAADRLQPTLLAQWGDSLQQMAEAARQAPPRSHGQRAAQRFQLRSAREEAAAGFPTLFEVTWPALQSALASGQALRAAKVHALFATMAVLDDTNLAHRGGLQAMRWAQSQAAAFLARGSVWQADWLAQARQLHGAFVERRLSPGGAADLIAGACFMHSLQDTAWRTR